jgi:hypothetical protein
MGKKTLSIFYTLILDSFVGIKQVFIALNSSLNKTNYNFKWHVLNVIYNVCNDV